MTDKKWRRNAPLTNVLNRSNYDKTKWKGRRKGKMSRSEWDGTDSRVLQNSRNEEKKKNVVALKNSQNRTVEDPLSIDIFSRYFLFISVYQVIYI